jgi:hypothetical protein
MPEINMFLAKFTAPEPLYSNVCSYLLGIMARKSGSRYLNILRGKRTAAAKTRLLSYLAGEIDINYPSRKGNRPDREVIWVVPFSLPVSAGAKLAQYVNSARFAAVSGYVAGFVDNTAPAAASQLVLKGLLAPRASITTGRSGTGTDTPSKLTGLTYKNYGGQSVSVPFGEGSTAAQKDEDSVFRIIFGKVKEADGNNTCSFVPGSYSV